MSFISRWFAKKESEDWEQVLADLALDIKKRQTRLSEIRLRERRATLAVAFWALIIWAGYVVLWYYHLLPNVMRGEHRNEGTEQFVKFVPIFTGPVFILLVRRLVQVWYSRLGNAEEKTLKTLLAQQRAKIEEIKKKTNYYTTRNLLERYDDGSSGSSTATPPRPGSGSAGPGAGTPARQRVLPGGMATPGQTPVQQRGAGAGPVNGNLSASVNANGQTGQGNGSPLRPDLQRHLTPTPPALPPAHKHWYDRMADALLGEDVSSDPTKTKYALVCQFCYTHNGLVREEDYEDAQFVCPKCGNFNRSKRTLKSSMNAPMSPSPLGRMPVTPTTPGPPFSALQRQAFPAQVFQGQQQQQQQQQYHGQSQLVPPSMQEGVPLPREQSPSSGSTSGSSSEDGEGGGMDVDS